MPNATTAPKRKHKASYATDKRSGGYLVRIVGPNAAEFAGREVPVSTRNGDEHPEKLARLIWAGVDTGTDENPGTGQPCALYKFESKPKQAKEIEF